MFQLTLSPQFSELYNVDSTQGEEPPSPQHRPNAPRAEVLWAQVRAQFDRAMGTTAHAAHQAFVDLWTQHVLDTNPADCAPKADDRSSVMPLPSPQAV